MAKKDPMRTSIERRLKIRERVVLEEKDEDVLEL